MAKRKAESESANLTPDHKMSGITLIYLYTGDVLHIVGKLLTKFITLLQISFKSNIFTKSYGLPKLRES
jgi:hypothetical protein